MDEVKGQPCFLRYGFLPNVSLIVNGIPVGANGKGMEIGCGERHVRWNATNRHTPLDTGRPPVYRYIRLRCAGS